MKKERQLCQMEITIRRATPDDAELIADLSRQTFYDTFAPQNTAEDMALFLDTQFPRSALVAEAAAPNALFLLATADAEMVGYARLCETKTNPHGIEIARLYATTAAIGKGVGKALMQACIEIAHERTKTKIWLGVWEKNTRAINFYTAWGFEKVGEHDFRLGNDLQRDWIMQKNL
ncbi:MAG TPA: GNAT family N-acetyltransferase [Chitinophagaceae bacterium]|nr:GNAT family N-acetyltransferase [Chitinophagaceae bacterium]